MKAWKMELDWIRSALPPKNTEVCEENWMHYLEAGLASDKKLYKDWISFVPGSLAPCHLVVAAVQAMHNRGYDVSAAEALLPEGLAAAENQDPCALQRISARIYHLLNTAPRDPASPYWQYRQYAGWEDISGAAAFPAARAVDVESPRFRELVRAGWMAQIIGGALGTQIEGYTTANIRKVFGEVRDYTRPPETYNDDITYELAFLEGFSKHGYAIDSQLLADEWLELIPDGYSAEEMAIRNLRRGIVPPESGTVNNYFVDWIGVQMRTPLHGMLAPGNPELAARLAVLDGVISHSNSGLLGGIFNAALVSLAFVEKDVRALAEQTMACIPADSEYYAAMAFAWEQCKKHGDWEQAWAACEEHFKEYHWIHCYPNVAAELVALWYGEGDFDKTAYIIAMCGMDADCTAAPLLNAMAVLLGPENIPSRWSDPVGTDICTYMRRLNRFTLDELVDKTVDSVRAAVREGQA